MTDVHVEFSYTKNLGNFESAKVTYGITDTVRENETVDAAASRISSKVESLIIKKVQEIDAETNG